MKISKKFLGFWNFGYEFLAVGGDVRSDSADMCAGIFFPVLLTNFPGSYFMANTKAGNIPD